MSKTNWARTALENHIVSHSQKDSPNILVNQEQNQARMRCKTIENGHIWVYRAAVQQHLKIDHKGHTLMIHSTRPLTPRSVEHIARRKGYSSPDCLSEQLARLTPMSNLHAEPRIHRKR